MKRLGRRIKHFFVAHRGNRFRPGLFTKEAAVALVAVLLVCEGLYLVQVKLVLNNSGFLATVLPAALTTLANADRVDNGLAPLTRDARLDAVAQAKADDMAATGYFAHISPEGKTPWDFLKAADYPYTYAGENLAVDFTDSEDVERAWMNSPAHRANLLKRQYTRVGIAVAQGMYEGKQVTFVAQYFATERGDAAVATEPISQAQDIAAVVATEPAEISAPQGAQVLGESTKPASAPEAAPKADRAAVLQTSPTHVLWYVFGTIGILLALLFSATLFSHARRKLLYMEVLGSGFLVVGVVAALFLYGGASTGVSIPADEHAASISPAR